MEIMIVALVSTGAIAWVLLPILRPGRAPGRPPALGREMAETGAGGAASPEPESLEFEVERYRAALRSATVCGRCLQANPPGSRFCSDCGRALDRGRNGE